MSGAGGRIMFPLEKQTGWFLSRSSLGLLPKLGGAFGHRLFFFRPVSGSRLTIC